MDAKSTLKHYFGYDSFRGGQEEVVNAILEGRDVLAIMPTGAGKSICYQIPALMLDGITIVVSPLISLMQDQVKALNKAGVHAAYINSSLTESQISKALFLASQGTYKIIYVAPERLGGYEFNAFARSAHISMVTIDEAHCISQWGQDFRPAYLKILDFVNGLPKRPVVSAFTATATKEVKDDILCILNLNAPKVVITGFDRQNLYYRVEQVRKKDAFIVDYIKEHPDQSGIIYCATRKNTDAVCELLKSEGIRASEYHAGLGTEQRKNNQDDFIYDRVDVIVATNAFGMGIDKPDVRFVIHYNMPQSMENYYQEAGRAGRDGEPAECILLFSPQDVVINRMLLDSKDFSDTDIEDIELIKQRDMYRLRVMENYCRTTECLRNYILRYFGENTGEPCNNCGNCNQAYTEYDMTDEARWVVNCIAETHGRYGLTIVIGTLMGADRARLRELGTTGYRSYGALKDMSETDIRLLISRMIQLGYIYQTQEQYSVLRIGNIESLRSEAARVVIRKHEKTPEQLYYDTRGERRGRTGRTGRREAGKSSGSKVRGSKDSLTAAGYELFEKLRQLRLEIAREESVPPYIVFSDKTLADMCIRLPKDRDAMLDVSGVGAGKYERYGQRFMDAIEAFVNEHPGAVTTLNAF